MGLLHDIAPAAELGARVAALAKHMSANGPAAMAAAKELARSVSRGAIDEPMIADTAGRIADIRASNEGREGVSAFLEKRRPGWG
jgi:methylglutaconyl-CoA hydratase